MANAYEIPWAVPDIRPGAQMLLGVLQQNRENARSDEFAKIQRDQLKLSEKRMSAEEHRRIHADQVAEDERQRKRDMERSQMLLSGQLFQAARKSPELATEAGKPYGVSFAREQAAPPSLAGTDLFKAAGNAYGNVAKNALAGDAPTRDEVAPEAGATEGHDPVAAAEAFLSKPRESRLQATMGGHTFDVPQAAGSLGLGAEYDARYAALQEVPGVTPEEALKTVFAEYKADKAQKASADRTAASIDFRRDEALRSRPDIDKMEEWLKMRLNQSDINSRRAASSKVAAAGAGATPPGLAELLRMRAANEPDEAIAARAAELDIPVKVWGPQVKETGRTAEKHSQLTVTAPDGEVLGEAHDAVAKRKLDEANIAYTQLVERTKALADDVRNNGSRVFMPGDIQRRDSLKAAAAAAGRKYHELGVSNANIELEHKILGPSGTLGDGFIVGANADVIDETLKEAGVKHKAGMAVRLRSGAPGNVMSPQLTRKTPAREAKPPKHGAGSGMVTIRDSETGETKRVTRDEARRLGAIR